MENALSLAEFDEIVLAHADEDIDDVLEHYGRLGMKWYQHLYGEVDGRAKYDQKWKNKETKKVQSKYASKHAKMSEQANEAFMDEKIYKGRSILKLRNALRDQARKEITTIAGMTSDQILKEVKDKHKYQAKRIIKAIFTLGLSEAFAKIKATEENGNNPLSTAEFKTKARTGTTRTQEYMSQKRNQIYNVTDYDGVQPFENFDDAMAMLGIDDKYLHEFDTAMYGDRKRKIPDLR